MSNILDLSYEESEAYIRSAGGANDFGNTLPSSLFWLWLYVATPLYNLGINVEKYPFFPDLSITRVGYWFVSEIIPMTISKRLIEEIPFVDIVPRWLILENITASTGLVGSYNILGVLGFYSYLSLLMLFYYFLFNMSKNVFYKLSISLLFTSMSILTIFDNMLIMPSYCITCLILMGIQIRLG